MPAQFQTYVGLWIMPNSDVNDEMLWLQSPSRTIVTTLAVDNDEKSQVGISINPFYDIYHKIYLF